MLIFHKQNWRIKYRIPGSHKIHEMSLRSANDQLTVSAAGTYELVSVCHLNAVKTCELTTAE